MITAPANSHKYSKTLFSLTALNLLLVIIFRVIDIYKYALVGAIFEMLWLIMLLALIVIPAVVFWSLYKRSVKWNSLYLCILIMWGITVMLFVF